jgi:hypothetical protein
MANNLNAFYVNVKVFDDKKVEVYQSFIPKSTIDSFTIYFFQNYPTKYYFKIYNAKEKCVYDSRLLKIVFTRNL